MNPIDFPEPAAPGPKGLPFNNKEVHVGISVGVSPGMRAEQVDLLRVHFADDRFHHLSQQLASHSDHVCTSLRSHSKPSKISLSMANTSQISYLEATGS